MPSPDWQKHGKTPAELKGNHSVPAQHLVLCLVKFLFGQSTFQSHRYGKERSPKELGKAVMFMCTYSA